MPTEDDTLAACRSWVERIGQVQSDKLSEYGPSWWAFRVRSLVDKVYIKARRVQTIQMTGRQLVDDSVEDDLAGIFSYAVMALAKLRIGDDVVDPPPEWSTPERARASYDLFADEILEVMRRKNTDYGEAWRSLRPETMVDEILARIVRIDHLLAAPEGDKTKVVEDQLVDVANYALFLLVRGQRHLPDPPG